MKTILPALALTAALIAPASAKPSWRNDPREVAANLYAGGLFVTQHCPGVRYSQGYLNAYLQQNGMGPGSDAPSTWPLVTKWLTQLEGEDPKLICEILWGMFGPNGVERRDFLYRAN